MTAFSCTTSANILDKSAAKQHKVGLTFVVHANVVHANSTTPGQRNQYADRVQEKMITTKAGTNDE
jgi:hypothetical protein